MAGKSLHDWMLKTCKLGDWVLLKKKWQNECDVNCIMQSWEFLCQVLELRVAMSKVFELRAAVSKVFELRAAVSKVFELRVEVLSHLNVYHLNRLAKRLCWGGRELWEMWPLWQLWGEEGWGLWGREECCRLRGGGRGEEGGATLIESVLTVAFKHAIFLLDQLNLWLSIHEQLPVCDCHSPPPQLLKWHKMNRKHTTYNITTWKKGLSFLV